MISRERELVGTAMENIEMGAFKGYQARQLFVACKDNDFRTVQEIINNLQHLVRSRNESGESCLHIACENNHAEIVEALLAVAPRGFCLLKDNSGQVPLHIATRNGNERIMNALIRACPRSLLALTPQRETALHLAIKHNHIDACQVLLERITEIGHSESIRRILEKHDLEGNNVLHIAVLNKQLPILEKLLGRDPVGALLMPVDSRNMRGLTAFELHLQNIRHGDDSDTTLDMAITSLLENAEAWSSLESQSFSTTQADNSTDHAASSLYLVIPVMVASSVFTSIFNLSDPVNTSSNSNEIREIKIRDVLMHPELTFYSIAAMTLMFTISIAWMGKVIWLKKSGWSFSHRALSMFVLSTFFLSYAFTTKLKIPTFSVRFGSQTISSFWFMWLFVVFLILIAFTIRGLAKMLNTIFFK